MLTTDARKIAMLYFGFILHHLYIGNNVVTLINPYPLGIEIISG